jgi:hypothetical protein
MERPTIPLDHAAIEANRQNADAIARASFVAQAMKTSKETMQPSMLIGPPVTIRELAQRLKMDVSACRRYVLALGYTPIKQRTASSGYQQALTLTPAEAEAIFQKRHAEGYC